MRLYNEVNSFIQADLFNNYVTIYDYCGVEKRRDELQNYLYELQFHLNKLFLVYEVINAYSDMLNKQNKQLHTAEKEMLTITSNHLSMTGSLRDLNNQMLDSEDFINSEIAGTEELIKDTKFKIEKLNTLLLKAI